MVGLGNTSWQKVPQVNYVLIISQVPLKKNLHPSNRKSLPPFGFSRLRGSLTLAVGGGIDKVVKNPATHVVCVKWSILQLPSCSIEIWELQRFKVPRSDPSRFEMQTELLSGMCSSPWSIFPRQQRSHCACGWVGGCNGWGMRWAGANRSTGLYSPEILSKLLSHHQSKLLNAFCIWRECSETVLWSVPSHGLGFTPHLGWSNHQLLLRSAAGSLSPAHRHPFLPFSLCWNRVAAHRHISSLSYQSIRTGADPLTQLTRWETWGMSTGVMLLQQLTARGSREQGQPVLALSPAALPSPTGWCWCSWSYAAGQSDLIQQKFNVTTKQKTKKNIYTLMGMVLSLVSVCSLQTPLLVPGNMQEHTGEAKGRAGKQSMVSDFIL